MKISIVIPCFNEEENILEFHNELKNHISTIDCNFEILFVNDGSEDKTEDKIISITNLDDNIKLISFSQNFGHQKALKAGIDKSTGDAVITIDCDFQQPISLIKEFVREWKEEKFLVVHGIKKENKRGFIYSSVIFLAYKIINLFNTHQIDVNGSDFLLLDKKVVNEIKRLENDNILIRSFVSFMDFRKKKIFYNLNERKHGKSKYTLSKFFNIFMLALLSDFYLVKKKSLVKRLINLLLNKKIDEKYIITNTKNIYEK
ncbi:glycosyltransferase family 2 protein [Candidatus Pelagibacter sp.]|nr:glycosyltransferase family 2 protein [Candidatus Pelagibacter sp.]